MFGITRAPDFDKAGLVWFNTARPLRLCDLAGRLVILDFWTLCCINCIQAAPTLRRIVQTFPDEVAVIGVHSPKFPHEKDGRAVADAITRYDIRHPVVHDPGLALWDEYAVRAWPTLVFVSPDGHVLGNMPGEPHPDLLLNGLCEMLRQFRERGELSARPCPSLSGTAPLARGQDGFLRFPGKLRPAPRGRGGERRWVVADSGHHQVVMLDDDGRETSRYGDGEPGFSDGACGEARFRDPQGVACGPDAVYVADTGNHALRRIDLKDGRVSTLAGSGRRGTPLKRKVPAPGTSLASPWDVETDGARLYFANAGTHQIGLMELSENTLAPLAGNGGESIADGRGLDALLTQPSGLALDRDAGHLFFTDSESSAVRLLSLADGGVRTLTGCGLFAFGHVNGPLDQARLQHPLGLCLTPDGRIIVADSYNHALRRIDPAQGVIADIPFAPCADGGTEAAACVPLAEPAGVWADGAGRLLVSDTNNHRIVEVLLSSTDMKKEAMVRTWAG